MTNDDLINWCIDNSVDKPYLTFSEEIFSSLDYDQAKMLAEKFADSFLILLPKKEIDFFEWLKVEDNTVWIDLWGNDSINNPPYIVSISFLPLLIEKNRGFPICDLLTTDNYYFTEAQIVDEESKIMIESAKEIFLAKKPLTIAQLLALEISFSPVDIWRFAYIHHIELNKAKQAVASLVEDNVLIHLTDASHLAVFIKL